MTGRIEVVTVRVLFFKKGEFSAIEGLFQRFSYCSAKTWLMGERENFNYTSMNEKMRNENRKKLYSTLLW